MEELILDEEAIDTEYLTNPKFIGDYIDMTVTPNTEEVVIIYMGTFHPRQGEQGFGGFTDERIFSWRVAQ